MLQVDPCEPVEGAGDNQEILIHGSHFSESHVIIFKNSGERIQENVAPRDADSGQAIENPVQKLNFDVDLR